MRYAALIPGCAALILAGCTETQHINTQVGATSALLTSADLRIITDRPAPNIGGTPGRRAMCTEPSPDVAKALSTALSLSAQANIPNGAGGAGSLNSQTVEQAMELAGRVPGVIALRDGTYRLCEAWANGAIGDSAYALALGRYGELLVTLMLGEDMVASTRSQPGTLTGSLAQNQSGNQAGGGTGAAGTSKPAQQTPAGTGTQVGQAGQLAGSTPVKLASLDWGPLLTTAADAITTTTTTPTTKPGTAPPAPATQTTGPATTPAPATKTAASASPSGGTTGSGAGSNADGGAVAQALVKMQENYLTMGAAGPLIAACIASADMTTPSRASNPGWSNDVLTTRFCQDLLTGYISAIGRVSAVPGTMRRGTAISTAHR